ERLWTTWLMRFAHDGNTVVQSWKVEMRPRAFAVSWDDSRIAIATCAAVSGPREIKGWLHILDRQFSVLKVLPLPEYIDGLKFLRSGNLLLAGNSGILQMNEKFE